jgi:hypothetical protein
MKVQTFRAAEGPKHVEAHQQRNGVPDDGKAKKDAPEGSFRRQRCCPLKLQRINKRIA